MTALVDGSYITALEALSPLLKRHHAKYFDSTMFDVDNADLLEQYVRLTKQFPISLEYESDPRIAKALEVTGDLGFTNYKITVNSQPFQSMGAAGQGPRDWTDEAGDDLDNFMTRLDHLIGEGIDLSVVNCFAFDLEWDGWKPTDQNRADLLLKLQTLQRAVKRYFPNAMQIWYGYQGLEPNSSVASGWVPHGFFPDDFIVNYRTCSLYFLNEVSLCREIFTRTILQEGDTVPHPTIPHVGLGGYVPRTAYTWTASWSTATNYPKANSYTLGGEINDKDAWFSTKPGRFAQWNYAPCAYFWPAPFGTTGGPYWAEHFLAYCQGCHGVTMT